MTSLARWVTKAIAVWHDRFMAGTDGTNGNGVAGHFGRQMRRDRLAHGWSVHELSRRTGINAAHLSRIEHGTRPPTARTADALDNVFPERRGWYLLWLDDIRTAPEIPATFRNWADFEEKSAALRVWTPGIIDGLAQTEAYAAALIATELVSEQAAGMRLRARMARQRRVLDGGQLVTLLVDETALYRLVGSPEIMGEQCRHLLAIAVRPGVILQVVPEIAHASVASAYIVADDAVWSESVIAGGTYTAAETLTATTMRFDTLRGECYRVSESLALIERLGEAWITGAHRPTRRAGVASA